MPPENSKSGQGSDQEAGGTEALFVIQKHDARNLHYDFRLEIDGVLKSWAVPKGPSTDPSVRRLAIPTEDHALEYADFEGAIPEERYGGGAVLVWDRGTYRGISRKDGEPISPAGALRKGHLSVRLEGRKLRGGYTLVRTGKGPDARWLLIKMRDEDADPERDPVAEEPRSVLSSRTIEQIREGAEG